MAAQTTTLHEPRPLEGPFLHVQPRRPCNESVRLDTSGTRPFVGAVPVRTPDAAMRTSPSHVYYLGRFSRDGDYNRRRGGFPEMATSIAGGASTARQGYPRCLEHQVFQDQQLSCPKHVGATATIFVAAQPPEPLPKRTTDGCCYYHVKTSFKPDGSVGAGGGSADPARTSAEGAAPTTPPGGVIDHMRQ